MNTNVSNTILLITILFILVVELIHNVSGGFEGIVIRWYSKYYNELNQMIRFHTPRRVFIRGLRATSRALDISGLIIGSVFSLLVMQSTQISWQYYLALVTLGMQAAYVAIRGGAWLIWLIGQIIKSRFWAFSRKKYQETGQKKWFMPAFVVESVDNPTSAPEEFDPKQFLRFDVASLLDDMWYAIDMWQDKNLRFMAELIVPRALLFGSRLILYALMIGKIAGVA